RERTRTPPRVRIVGRGADSVVKRSGLRTTGDSARIVSGESRFEPFAFRIEDTISRQAPFLQRELQCGRQNPKAILDTPPEVDRRGFREIFCGARNLPNLKAKVGALREHLVVENKIVRVFEKRKFREDLAAEGAISG